MAERRGAEPSDAARAAVATRSARMLEARTPTRRRPLPQSHSRRAERARESKQAPLARWTLGSGRSPDRGRVAWTRGERRRGLADGHGLDQRGGGCGVGWSAGAQGRGREGVVLHVFDRLCGFGRRFRRAASLPRPGFLGLLLLGAVSRVLASAPQLAGTRSPSERSLDPVSWWWDGENGTERNRIKS